MSKFRILSIFLAVGLLVGALGVGPVLAGQIDVTGLDTRDASYAPAQLAVKAGEVEWTMDDGEDIKFVKADTSVNFYINDDDLETTSAEQIATWGISGADGRTPTGATLPATNGVTEGFNVLTGEVDGTGTDFAHDPTQTTVGNLFSLTGPADEDMADAAAAGADGTLGTPDDVSTSGGQNKNDLTRGATDDGLSTGTLIANNTGVDENIGERFANNGFATTTFVMFTDDGVIETATSTDNADPPVINDVRPLGGQEARTPIHSVTSFIAVVDVVGDGTGSATSTLTAQTQNTIEAERNLVKVLGGTLSTFNFVEIKFKHHKVDTHAKRARVVSTSDPQGEYVMISEVGAVGSMTANASSDVFHGSVMISSDSDTRGPGAGGVSDGVWVNDGDTLTVQYLDADGDVVDSDSITVDSAKPAIGSISPASGTNTDVGNPTLQFTALDTGSGIPVGTRDVPVSEYFDVYIGTTVDDDGDLITMSEDDDTPAAGTPIDADDLAFVATADGYQVIFSSAESWVTRFDEVTDSQKFYVTLRARDLAGNQGEATIAITIDDSNPTAISARTGVAWNDATEKEKTGVSNAVRLTMSEPIDPDSVAASDFEIGGVAAATAVVGGGDNVEDASFNVYLTTEADLDPDARPRVEVVAAVSDLSGNLVDITKDTAGRTADDGIGPTVTVTRDLALVAAKDDKVVVSIVSDEKVKAGGVKVSVQGPDGSNANTGAGAKGAKAGDPLMYSVTETVKANAATGAYGIAVQITDLGNNASDNLVSVSDEEATVKDGAIVTAKGPIADSNFDGAIDHMDISAIKVMDENGATVGTTTVSLVVDSVDAGGRMITLKNSHAGGKTAEVSYKHVSADNTFEIDMSGPGASFSVAEDAELTNRSPFIRVTFDDDEYPGDSYTDVALSAATLTMGDDETDISGDFDEAANGYEYLWRGVNLALGEHTLTVTGTDTAGNETEASVTFSIIERPATQIALTPGDNLISLPGTPATTSVEGVFGDSDVQSILTYDPSTPTKWLAAERAPDGSWVGNLTEVSASLGYWVTTTSFAPLSVDIVSFRAGTATTPPTHSLLPGWNLIAVTTLEEVLKTADAEAIDANMYLGNNWLRAITYNPETGRFVSLGPDDEEAPMLEVGKGYYVWMTRAHTVVP